MITATKPRGFVAVAKPLERSIPVLLKVDTAKDIAQKAEVLPFLPRAGDMLGVGYQGDYWEVDQLFWSPEDGFIVWFERDTNNVPSLKKLQEDGWEHGT